MKTKTSHKDFSETAVKLSEKYKIDEFNQQVKKIFESTGFDSSKIDEIIKNPKCLLQDNSVFNNISAEQLAEKFAMYEELKKLYCFNSYMDEGVDLRKVFIKQRKDYFFNKHKIYSDRRTAKTPVESLSFDYTEQYTVARWLDLMIKKVYPSTVKITYEDYDGNLIQKEVVYKKVEITEEFVDAPLIDRIGGKTIFDGFLNHSFYDLNERKWIYIPVKLIQKIENRFIQTKAKEK